MKTMLKEKKTNNQKTNLEHEGLWYLYKNRNGEVRIDFNRIVTVLRMLRKCEEILGHLIHSDNLRVLLTWKFKLNTKTSIDNNQCHKY